ncbi:wax ester/triacylglycerol synthase domain-containing protein [Streptomyces apocyni]|uniref:wax ester/triacylglycerol synthase domain-containing protein n=1 Tax=Streptomyces apocyni TaxID=2654677 RepID=UPI0012EAFE22|nr:wax ester/triacylglycerol synthase domain-containing protein [Streptomyces apocyni]
MKQPLNPIDEVFLSQGRDPGPILGQFIRFRGNPPSLDVLHKHLADRLPDLSRLTHRPVTDQGRMFRTPSPDFDLRDHLAERELPAGTSLDEALTAVVRHPLPRDGPPWSLELVHGYETGEYAVCYRVHHALEDGLGAVHVVATLFGDGPQTVSARKGEQPIGPFPSCERGGPLFPAGASELLRGTLSVSTLLARGLLPVRPWPRAPRPDAAQLATCSVSATRQELGTLGRKFGGTVNDAFLMALRGALADWSTEGKARDIRSVFQASPVPVRMPLSTRDVGEGEAVGNHLATAVVTLPAREATSALAFGQLVENTHRMRSNGLRPASRVLVRLLPSAVTRWTVRRLLNPRAAPLYASSYTLPNSLSLHGDPVVDVVPLGVLLPGNALSVTLLSCGSRVRVSFLYDRRVPGAERLAVLWRGALDELLLL